MVNSSKVSCIAVLLALLLHAGLLYVTWDEVKPSFSGVAKQRSLEITFQPSAHAIQELQRKAAALPVVDQDKVQKTNKAPEIAEKVNEPIPVPVPAPQETQMPQKKVALRPVVQSRIVQGGIVQGGIVQGGIVQGGIVQGDNATVKNTQQREPEKRQEAENPVKQEMVQSGLQEVLNAQEPSMPESAAKAAESNAESTSTGSAKAILRDAYLHTLRSLIEQHKRYPRMALQRRRQGSVTLSLEIDKEGNASQLGVSAGDRMFFYNSLKAVREALPLPPPDELAVPVQVELTLRYHL